MITLSPVSPALAELYLQLRQDPEARRFNPFVPSTLESLRTMLAKASSDLKNFEEAEDFRWAITYDSEPVGNLSLKSINRMMMTAEIGYGVSPTFRGKGIATAALRMLAKKVFAETPLRKLSAYVHEDNQASRRVLEKAGFKHEGLLREQYLIDGKPVNEALYGLLKRELL